MRLVTPSHATGMKYRLVFGPGSQIDVNSFEEAVEIWKKYALVHQASTKN